MSKTIKHVVAATLILCSASAVMPSINFRNLEIGSVAANASEYKGAATGELSKLTLYRGSGSELQLRKSYYGDETYLSSGKDYYVELNGSEGIEVDAEVKGDGYVVKVFDSASKDAEGKDPGDFIKIDSSNTNLYIRTYRSEEDYRNAYDDENVTKCVKTYIIHIKKPNLDSDEELNAEYAYLKSIYLSDGSIDFTKKKFTYDVYVDENVEELTLRAKPDGSDYSVDINDKSVDEDDDYETTVNLDKGKNVIKIKVESDDDEQVYTLNVYRQNGQSLETTNSNNIGNINEGGLQRTSGTRNSWQKSGGKWQYIDGTGQPIKDKWWFDVKTGNSYYLDADGNMKTGWISYNNKWYYSNSNGEMQIGWINDGGNWYYLNKGGAMVTGWAEDTDGKWYYFGSNGIMATNTEIDGCKLDSDGAWVK